MLWQVAVQSLHRPSSPPDLMPYGKLGLAWEWQLEIDNQGHTARQRLHLALALRPVLGGGLCRRGQCFLEGPTAGVTAPSYTQTPPVIFLYKDPSVPVAMPVGPTASAGQCKVLGA